MAANERAAYAVVSSASSKRQIAIALAACCAIAVPAAVLSMPVMFVAVSLAPLAVLVVFGNPFLVCLGFVIFSFFRIHEAFPVLAPFHIPQALAMAALTVLGWQIVLKKSIELYWSRELTAFAVLFALVTVGLVFAASRPDAIGYWTETYVKIALMTVAIACSRAARPIWRRRRMRSSWRASRSRASRSTTRARESVSSKGRE